jgi:hypothetical protein
MQVSLVVRGHRAEQRGRFAGAGLGGRGRLAQIVDVGASALEK